MIVLVKTFQTLMIRIYMKKCRWQIMKSGLTRYIIVNRNCFDMFANVRNKSLFTYVYMLNYIGYLQKNLVYWFNAELSVR